ncbi:MAG: hypothetical protein ACKO6D_00185, partial [Rubrivivax sp.]
MAEPARAQAAPAAAPAAARAPAPAASAGAGVPDASVRAVRRELGDLIEEARKLFQEEKFDAAAARLEAADALPDLKPWERHSLERMRAAVALRQQRYGVSVRALEAAFATNEVPEADALNLMRSLVDLALREKDYARVLAWSRRYADKGGTDEAVGLMRLEALRFSGDERGALQGWKARPAALGRTGSGISESPLCVLWALSRR